MAQYTHIADFEKFIKNNTNSVPNMLSGSFYTYHYNYKATPELLKRVPKHILDIYVGRPVVYIFDVFTKGEQGHPYALGINFHFMPVKSRKLWLNKFVNLDSQTFAKEGRSKIKEPIMSAAYKKSKKAYRIYDFRKITYLKKIPNSQISELMNYTPYTHEFKHPDSIFNIYRQTGLSWNY